MITTLFAIAGAIVTFVGGCVAAIAGVHAIYKTMEKNIIEKSDAKNKLEAVVVTASTNKTEYELKMEALKKELETKIDKNKSDAWSNKESIDKQNKIIFDFIANFNNPQPASRAQSQPTLQQQ